MKNAIKYGFLIGVLSGIWILIMHLAGFCDRDQHETGILSWLEYAFIIIPLAGLYLGIKNYRDHINGGRMSFFEGLFEGFKIIIVGGVVASLFAVIYLQFCSNVLITDYMERIVGIGFIAILFNLAIPLVLMNKQKEL